MPVGRVSWFGGPGDPSSGPTTASGAPVTDPGIAVYSTSTLGGYWLVKMPNGRQAVLQQTDIGPAPWTGRSVDFTYSALPSLGYSTSSFPTDASVSYQYLGKSVPGSLRGLLIGAGGAATAAPAGAATSSSAPGGIGGFLLRATLTVALLLAGVWLLYQGANGLLGGRPRRALRGARAIAAVPE